MFEIIVTVLLVLLVLIVYFQEKRIKTMTEGLYNLSLSQQYSIEASKIQNDFNQALSDSHTHTNDKLDRVIERMLPNVIEEINQADAFVTTELESLKYRVSVLESRPDPSRTGLVFNIKEN